ncbi:MAG: hypothetical protein M3365_10850, partial [Gemmatimonadota bacterium]|nr:hypothetical protein [Gemmatimonadota bacterium]
LMLTVSNGRSLGGAFQIAPNASVTDGELDIAYFADCTVAQRARAFASAFRGTHGQLSTVRTEKRDELTLEFAAAPLMEIDGELYRASTPRVVIQCLPRALRVISAEGAIR